MLDAFMHNLHYFFLFLPPPPPQKKKNQFLPPKVIVSLRNGVKLCLFPFIQNIEEFH